MKETKQKDKQKVRSKKQKLVPITRLKGKLWEQFSLFIRLRDADMTGNIRCCTTGYERHWKQSQAGHFHSQRGNPALIFEENNVHAQSPLANKLQKNNITWDYFKFMYDKYGMEELERLASLRKKPFPLKREWLEEQIKHYKKQVELLKQQKGL